MTQNLMLDCNACKTLSVMVSTKIPKFGVVVRVIGVLLLIPSFLGLAFAALVLVSTAAAGSAGASSASTDAAQAGAAIAFVIGFGFSLFVGAVSLISGLLGWLLLLNRKVYKCLRCGFVFDRA